MTTDPTACDQVMDALAKMTGKLEAVASDPTDGFECYWLRVAVPYAPPMRGFRVDDIGAINGPQNEQQKAWADGLQTLHNLSPVLAADYLREKARADVAEAEVARLRGALERLCKRDLSLPAYEDFMSNPDNYLRAALTQKGTQHG